MGPPFEQCTSCHGVENDPITGIPGTTNPHFNPGQPLLGLGAGVDGLGIIAWRAPQLSGPQLCANLLNMALNGNRTPAQLLQHITTEPLVKWAFNPGIRPNGQGRTTPPISQANLILALEDWIAEGTPCPAK